MRAFERVINRHLGRSPHLKNAAKNLYQRTLSLVPRSDDRARVSMNVHQGYFFGFHDLTPWSSDDARLLALRPPASDDPRGSVCDVGQLDENGHFDEWTTTRAWNWQEGARLQWVGARHSVALNDLYDGRVHCRFLDVDRGTEQIFPVGVHTVSHSGDLATTVDYDRIAAYSRAYSYEKCEPSRSADAGALGLLHLDSGEREALYHPEASRFADGLDYVSHTTFSPDDRRIAFFHNCLRRGLRINRLLVLDRVSGSVVRLTRGNWVSHYCWCGNDTLLAFDEDEAGQRRFRIHQLGAEAPVAIEHGELLEDGHPSSAHGGRWIVLDTYPDGFMIQRLKLMDLQSVQMRTLLELRVPYRYRYEERCDFHPRWNRRGTHVCFDSAHDSERSLCVLDVSAIVGREDGRSDSVESDEWSGSAA